MKKIKKKAATALKKSKRSKRREEEVRKKGAVSRHRTNKMTDALHQVGIRHKCLSLSAHSHTQHTQSHTHILLTGCRQWPQLLFTLLNTRTTAVRNNGQAQAKQRKGKGEREWQMDRGSKGEGGSEGKFNKRKAKQSSAKQQQKYT